MTDMLRAALYYAKHNLPVFPIWPVIRSPGDPAKFVCACNKELRCDRPGKHPMAALVPHGLTDATTDPDGVKHFWSMRPDANIAISCTSKLVVLDTDDVESLDELERQHGLLPQTWKARTGRGGFHHYFAGDPTQEIRNSTSKVARGIDVRANGGYVVAPPSKHASGGAYTWEFAHRASLAPLPAWLLAAARSGPKAAAARKASEVTAIIGNISCREERRQRGLRA